VLTTQRSDSLLILDRVIVFVRPSLMEEKTHFPNLCCASQLIRKLVRYAAAPCVDPPWSLFYSDWSTTGIQDRYCTEWTGWLIRARTFSIVCWAGLVQLTRFKKVRLKAEDPWAHSSISLPEAHGFRWSTFDLFLLLVGKIFGVVSLTIRCMCLEGGKPSRWVCVWLIDDSRLLGTMRQPRAIWKPQKTRDESKVN